MGMPYQATCDFSLLALKLKVQRLVNGEAANTGGVLSFKGFTAALLACCSCDLSRERLFRLLRGEGGWRRVGEGMRGKVNPAVFACTHGVLYRQAALLCSPRFLSKEHSLYLHRQATI